MTQVMDERNARIQRQHLERAAYVYVRQSSPRQVIEHLESQRRQYDLVSWATTAGWPAERIVVIDEDQGKSASAAKTRPGFARLSAAVAQGQVGIVIALEVTRLSRNSPDWHHLLYLCRFTGTLIADEHTIYDPDHATDRLVLGIRGQMSEMEIDTMIERMVSARWNKAARGELYTIPPAGYDLDRLGRVFQDTRFMFFATDRLQTQIVFSIGPVNPDKGSKLLFIQHLIHLSSPVQCVIPSYAGTCELEFCEAIIGSRYCGRP